METILVSILSDHYKRNLSQGTKKKPPDVSSVDIIGVYFSPAIENFECLKLGLQKLLFHLFMKRYSTSKPVTANMLNRLIHSTVKI